MVDVKNIPGKINIEGTLSFKKKFFDINDFPIDEFKEGLKVELEHLNTINELNGDIISVAKIVLDHLKEDPEYYTKLKKAKL